jgi:hypothetical protein
MIAPRAGVKISLEQSSIQVAAHQFRPEADEGGAFRGRLAARKITDPTEVRTIIKGVGKPHVRHVVPGRQQQRPRQRQWRPPGLSLG